MESTRILSNFNFQWTKPYTRILYKLLPGGFRLNANSPKAIQKKVVYQNLPSYFIQFKVCSHSKQL